MEEEGQVRKKREKGRTANSKGGGGTFKVACARAVRIFVVKGEITRNNTKGIE